MGRTNIDLDDALVAGVMRRYRLRTKREAVDVALRRVDVEPMDDAEAAAVEGIGWHGDLDAMLVRRPSDLGR